MANFATFDVREQRYACLFIFIPICVSVRHFHMILLAVELTKVS